MYSDGSDHAMEAVSLLEKMGAASSAQVTILSVAVTGMDHFELDETVRNLAGNLYNQWAEVAAILKSGEPTEESVEAAQHSDDYLVIVARKPNRKSPRIRARSSTKQLARNVPSHLLLTRNVPKQLRKILLCTGADSPSLDTVHLAGLLTTGSGAGIYLLHVMSEVALRGDSPSEDLEKSASEAMQKHNREWDHIAECIRVLRQQGISAKITPIIRHGLVVDQVMAEIYIDNYILLVLGSHQQPNMTHWLDFLLDDVTEEFLRNTPLSTLVFFQQSRMEGKYDQQ